MQERKFINVYRCTGFRQYKDDYVCTIEDTPENIAAFIVSAPSFGQLCVYDPIWRRTFIQYGKFFRYCS